MNIAMSISSASVGTYSYIRNGVDAFGSTHQFYGPGLSKFSNSIHILQPFNDWSKEYWSSEYSDRDAENIVGLLNAAYEAGRKSMQRDVKLLLGIKDHE
jgi:hypothetical protein